MEEAGGLVLARGDEAVEVERDAELAIAWTAGGAQYGPGRGSGTGKSR